MNELFQMVYVDGDLVKTFVNILILFISFDCLLGFGNAIKSVKEAVL